MDEHLPGTDYTRIRFAGLAAETPEPLGLGDEVVFKLVGRVVLVGEELDGDNQPRDVAKVRVTSVTPA